MEPDLTMKADNTRPGTIIRDRSNRNAYYYEEDGSIHRIHSATINKDGGVVIHASLLRERISDLQAKYGSG